MHTGPDPITDEQIQGYVLSVIKDKHGEYQRQAERNAKEATDKATLPRDRPACRAWAEVSKRYADAFQVALSAVEMAFQAKAPTVETTVDELCGSGFPAQAERIKDGEPGTLAMVIEWVASVAPNHHPEDYADSPRALDALCALWLVTRGKMPQAKAEAAEVSP